MPKTDSKIYLLLLIILLGFQNLYVQAQLNNKAFENRMVLEPADSGKLFLGLHFLGFGKNNEYFNTTIDGYTLFGYQLSPYLSYHISKNVRLDAGVYLQKDFGNTEYSQTVPTLSLNVRKDNFNFIFGTLEGSLNHQLIEPLYDFERVLNKRLENGIQTQWIKDGLFLDIWVDWQKMIYNNDPDQEKLLGGLSLNKRIWKKGNTSIEFPLQLLIQHQGGQIDNNPDPVKQLFNGATGLTLKHASTAFIREWGLKSYVARYVEQSSARSQYFKDGWGVYINPYITTSFGLTVMGSYWHSDKFLSFNGGGFYPSRSEQRPERIDKQREIFMLRFLYDVKVADGLNFTLRAEPFYDTYSKAIEYSYGFYFNYYNRFFLLHARQSR